MQVTPPPNQLWVPSLLKGCKLNVLISGPFDENQLKFHDMMHTGIGETKKLMTDADRNMINNIKDKIVISSEKYSDYVKNTQQLPFTNYYYYEEFTCTCDCNKENVPPNVLIN